MFKKALQIIVTFGVLLGGYETYLLGFALLTDRISAASSLPPDWKPIESRTAREATRYAVESFGKDHWAAQPGLAIRLVDKDRGFYMYAGDYVRKEEGKKFEFFPFAIIWFSKGGTARKTATSERCLIELNEKMGIIKSGQEALHVIEAKLENNVMIRDDKGTLADRTDDLIVGPLPYIEYTEKTNPPEIRSVSDILMVDRDLTVTGYDLLIQLRKGEALDGTTSGFDAQMAKLKKNVHIVVKDVGKSGVLPGTAKSTTSDGPTPLDLRDEGEMQIDFPPKVKPARPNFVGPPVPEGPTFATFHRNVVVKRGKGSLQDILECDTLRLTLFPTPKTMSFEPRFGGALMTMGIAVVAPGAGGVWPHYGSDNEASGPLTELAIREANATGYAVWLTSTAQGIRAKCTELIYKKLMPVSEDETYLRGTAAIPIEVVKVDHEAPQPNPGKITSVTSIWATDAKIFDDGKGGSASTVRSRGPGRLETRPALNQPAEHGATWQIEMVMRTIPMPPDPNAKALPAGSDPVNPPTKRLVTLTGDPKLQDFAKAMKLEAVQWIIVSLKPREKTSEPKPAVVAVNPAGAETAPKDPLGSGSYQIEWLQARQNVRLTSPGKTMVARDELNAPFEQVAMLANEPDEPVKEEPPLVNNGVNAELPKVDGPAFAGQPGDPKAPAVAVAQPAKSTEPNVTVTAHRVWAKIRQAHGKSEIAEARLRGDVKFHQDPAPDKKRGTDVKGEALDLETLAGGKMKFRLFNTDPSAIGDSSRLASRGDVKLTPIPPARIDTEDYTIIGPAIYMDQSVDYAWVNGKGRLIQLAERGFLNDKGIEERIKAQNRQKNMAVVANKPPAEETKQPFTITWTEQMQFFGRATDLQGRPAGKIEFRGDVDAVMEDGRIHADELDTYTDRPVSLASGMKQRAKPKAAQGDTRKIDEILPVAINREDVPSGSVDGADDKPELAFVDARNNKKKYTPAHYVSARNVKRDQESGEKIESQYIKSEWLQYDRRSGKYWVPGKGEVFLWRRSAEGTEKPGALPGGPQPVAGRARALPVANGGRNNPANEKTPIVKKYQPWELTQIKFEKEMLGRFGSGKSEADNEWRTADCYGDVQVLNAPVANDMTAYSFDDHPKGFKRITSDSLRVVSEPPDPRDKGAAAQTFVTGEGNAQATTATHTVSADILKFDSSKDQFYAYGLGGRDVVVVNQAHPGQPGSTLRSQAAWYNHKTGANQPINPSTIQLLDANAGARPVEEKPAGPEAKKPRNQRPPLRPPSSRHIERGGFGNAR